VTKENLTIKASGNAGVPIIDGQGRAFNVSSGGVLIQGLKITNTKSTSNSSGGGGILMAGSGSSVSGCSFTNTTANGMGSGGIFMVDSGCSVVFNRFVNCSGSGNGVTCLSSCNVSSNWWGNNTPQSIPNGAMEDYYQVELSANQTSTRDLNNSSVNGLFQCLWVIKWC